jgi:hypothetical protein
MFRSVERCHSGVKPPDRLANLAMVSTFLAKQLDSACESVGQDSTEVRAGTDVLREMGVPV